MTPDGDYGYDMAHEEVLRRDEPRGPGGGPREQPRAGASEEDLGYDEAHDF